MPLGGLGRGRPRCGRRADLAWIRRQQAIFAGQARESPARGVSGETHWVEGRRYRLRVVERPARPELRLASKTILELRCPAGTSREQRLRLLDRWYRARLAAAIPEIIERQSAALGIPAPAWRIKRMKTKWGSYSSATGIVWLNSELAKKPVAALEYVVAHELAHVLLRGHSEAFTRILDRQMLHWRLTRAELGSLPLGHESWGD